MLSCLFEKSLSAEIIGKGIDNAVNRFSLLFLTVIILINVVTLLAWPKFFYSINTSASHIVL